MLNTKAFTLVIVFSFLSINKATASPLTLRETIRQAIENNLDVKFSEYSVKEKEGNFEKTIGEFDLNMNLGWIYDEDETPSASSLNGNGKKSLNTINKTLSLSFDKKFETGTQVRLPYSYLIANSDSTSRTIRTTHEPSFGIEISQPLLRIFSKNHFIKDFMNKGYDFEAAAKEHGQKINETIYKSIDLFYELLQERKVMYLRKHSYENSLKDLEFVQKKQQIGKASKIDLLDARSKSSKKEEVYLNTESNYYKLQKEFSNYVFSDPTRDVVLIATDIELEDPPQMENLNKLIEESIENRSDYKQRLAELKKATLNRHTSSFDRLPKVELDTDLTFKGLNQNFQNSHEEVSDFEYTSWKGEINIEQPLFMYAKRSSFKMAKLKLEQANLKLSQLKQDIALELQTSFKNINAHFNRVKALKLSLAAEKEKMKFSRAKYHLGKLSVFEFNQELENYEQIEVDLIKAQVSYIMAKYTLSKTKGVIAKEIESL